MANTPKVPRDVLLFTLATKTPYNVYTNEMTHRGVGRSDVEWWECGSIYVWRVRFIPKGIRKDSSAYIFRQSLVAYGVAWDAKTARQEARKAASENAKKVKANMTESDRLGL